MTTSTAVGSMTGLAEVAMTSFVPHFPAFMGVCMYLGLYVELQGFVMRFHCPSVLLMPAFFCLLAQPPRPLPRFARNLSFGLHSLLSLRLSLLAPNEVLLLFLTIPPFPALPLLFVSFQ